jgi:hypothetical protein
MIMQVVDTACVFAIAWRTHLLEYTTMLDNCQLSNIRKERGRIPRRLEVGGPLHDAPERSMEGVSPYDITFRHTGSKAKARYRDFVP